MCYICLEETEEPLIHPCSCTAGVHASCLEEWVRFSERDTCEICTDKYVGVGPECVCPWRDTFFVLSVSFSGAAFLGEGVSIPLVAMSVVLLLGGTLILIQKPRAYLINMLCMGIFLYSMVCTEDQSARTVGATLAGTSTLATAYAALR